VAAARLFCYLFDHVGSFVQQVSVWALPVLAAIILHEIAHGVVAYRLGDTTARDAGRLTLNPLPHIDPFGTVLLPLLLIVAHSPFLFGYALPVNFGKLRNPKRDMILVAAAGPLTNIVLAVASAALFKWILRLHLPAGGAWNGVLVAGLTPVALMAQNSVIFNVVLAVFNLLPILPLDGGRVLTGLLPLRQAIAFSRLERYGMMIVILLLMTNVIGRVVGPVVNVFLRVLL
jgi:Zn-dependent protease